MNRTTRSALTSISAGLAAAALVLACTACSAGNGGGGQGAATTSGGGGSSLADAASHYGNTGGSLEDACAAFANVNRDSGTGAEQTTVAGHWDDLAKYAPAEIAAKAYVVAAGQDKLAAGDPSGITDEVDADVHDITTWWLANCDGSNTSTDDTASPADPANDDNSSDQAGSENASAAALCHDLEDADVSGDTDAAMANGLNLWHTFIKDAPPDISDAVNDVSSGLDKAIAGDPSGVQGDSWAKSLQQVSAWEVANCQ